MLLLIPVNQTLSFHSSTSDFSEDEESSGHDEAVQRHVCLEKGVVITKRIDMCSDLHEHTHANTHAHGLNKLQ